MPVPCRRLENGQALAALWAGGGQPEVATQCAGLVELLSGASAEPV